MNSSKSKYESGPSEKPVVELWKGHLGRRRYVQAELDLLEACGVYRYRETAAQLSRFYGKPCSKITWHEIDSNQLKFREHLLALHYGRTAIAALLTQVGDLLKLAGQCNWYCYESMTPTEWLPFLDAIAKFRGQTLLRFLLTRERLPDTVRETDLDDYILSRIPHEPYARPYSATNSMRRCLQKAGFGSQLSISRVAGDHYGFPSQSFPEPLRSEVLELRHFKEHQPSRSGASGPIRAISSERLARIFSYLYGYALNIAGVSGITSIETLVSRPLCHGYLKWATEIRHSKGSSICDQLRMIHAALKAHPKYGYIGGTWLANIAKGIPKDSGRTTQSKKARKFLPYEVLAGIPDRMRSDRARANDSDLTKIALSARDELMMRFFIVLVWRQGNVRNVRLSGIYPNLFKAPFPRFTKMTKPDWVNRSEQANPNQEVWQVSFSSRETKGHAEIACVLPRKLIGPLEEYLALHRPHLIHGADPGYLFLNRQGGGPLTPNAVYRLVATYTLRYGGRAMSPHLFRTAFATMYLERVPQDYLTLSKILWHRDVLTTINIYGQRFNESTAMCRMERILGL